MALRRISILQIFLVLAALCTQLDAQPKYPFDFNEDWEYVQLMYGGYNISPESFSILNSFMEEVNIRDGRVIFGCLLNLDSLNNIKSIVDIPAGDSPDMQIIWRNRLDSAFRNLSVKDNLDALIATANIIRLVKKNYSAALISASYFKDNVLDAKIYDTISVKLNTDFIYNEAYDLLDCLQNSGVPDKVTDSVINTRTGLQYDSISYFVRRAADRSPLNTLYKMVNPSCYKGLGGVSLYTVNFRKILDNIYENEPYVKFEIKNKLFIFLPRSVYTKININFLLGFTEKNPLVVSSEDVRSESGDISVPLEYFGDNYNQMFKYITRKLFLSCREQIYYNLLPYVLSGKDTTVGTVISAVHEGGMLNYIAPLKIDNRPISLLQIDFNHFKRTIGEIRKGTNRNLIDTLISMGVSGNGLFYTMGTQMTFSIEKVIGLQAVKNSIIFGPVYFFRSYIEAYKEDPENIREVFRFSESMEESINSLENKIPEAVILDGANLIVAKNIYINEPDRWKDSLLTNISKLELKYQSSTNKYLMYCVISEMLFREKFYPEAYRYFEKAVPEIKDKIRVIRMLYGKFFNETAFDEALSLAELFIRYEPSSPEGYIYAGITYLKKDDAASAEESFTKALNLSYGNILYDNFGETAEKYLTEIKNSEK